ncbi:hypothetical protein Y10_01710 [Neptunitalea sp. Y10]|uniref:Uncharacterized protein n=2 Tax=Neptunitalea lumnitzerae TaxID=2965509 RepID=A0ABQ5MEK5_9FLAO|nr:hypothetical protein Y10_01710 [Neptunitalea sp. Y10]
MVNFNRKLAKKAGLSKDDQLQYLYMEVDFALPESDSISVPLFLFDVKNPASVKKFENYDGKLLDNINTNNMRANLNGKFKVKAMLSRESSGFWKELVTITTDIAKSASQLMLGNPFGASELLTCFQGRVSSGLDELGTLSDADKNKGTNGNTITQEHSFLINLIEYNKDPDYREVVTGVRLYRVHWSFDHNRGKSKFFKGIDNKDFPGPESFQNAVKNHTYPMILVVETRFMPKINSEEPAFTDAYQTKIAEEYLTFSEGEQPMFKHYVRNFANAYNIQKNLDNYLKNIHSTNESLKASLLIETIEESYLYKQNVAEEHKRYNYISEEENKDDRYALVANRYNEIDRQLNNFYEENKYIDNLAKSHQLLTALLNPLEGKETSSEALYNQISTLKYFDEILASVTQESYENKKSYIRYRALLKTYEAALFEKLTGAPEAEKELAFYQEVMENYAQCDLCVAECQKQITAMEEAAAAKAEAEKIAAEKAAQEEAIKKEETPETIEVSAEPEVIETTEKP